MIIIVRALRLWGFTQYDTKPLTAMAERMAGLVAVWLFVFNSIKRVGWSYWYEEDEY